MREPTTASGGTSSASTLRVTSDLTTRTYVPSDVRSVAIRQLTQTLLEVRGDFRSVFRALADCLSTGLCDGCAIVFARGDETMSPVTLHAADPEDALLAAFAQVLESHVYTFTTPAEALHALPEHAEYIRRFGLRALAVLPMKIGQLRGSVIVTRDGASQPFEAADLVAIATCIEYAGLAAGRALKLEQERSTVRSEREQFQQELVGLVGHDLRGPLGGILVGTEMLASEDVAVRRIVSFAKRMTRIVDRVLDLTMLRLGGGIPLALAHTKLSPLLRTAIERLSATYPESNFELVDATDARGLWDMERMAQVISSILRNAVQHGREGGTVSIGVARSDGSTRITVHNELRDKAQPPTEVTIGYGLQIAESIVRGHGGTLTIESSTDGTCVEIALPDAG